METLEDPYETIYKSFGENHRLINLESLKSLRSDDYPEETVSTSIDEFVSGVEYNY